MKITCICISRRVGMADEADSKSVVGNHVRVQVPLPAVNEKNIFDRARTCSIVPLPAVEKDGYFDTTRIGMVVLV